MRRTIGSSASAPAFLFTLRRTRFTVRAASVREALRDAGSACRM
jgi:hypothetical protein